VHDDSLGAGLNIHDVLYFFGRARAHYKKQAKIARKNMRACDERNDNVNRAHHEGIGHAMIDASEFLDYQEKDVQFYAWRRRFVLGFFFVVVFLVAFVLGVVLRGIF
jgi:hypothetical protein